MKRIIKQCKWIMFVVLLMHSFSVIHAQEPCDPTECCLENDGLLDQSIGILPNQGVDLSNHWFNVYGGASIVSQGCDDPNSIIIKSDGFAGSSVGYTNTINAIPTFEGGKSYCINFSTLIDFTSGANQITLRLKGSNNTPIGFPCIGNCTIIQDFTIDVNDMNCQDFNITWTPSVDYQIAVFALSEMGGSGDPASIFIDNICIDAQSGSECMADFELLPESECGEFCFENTSCGDNLQYTWNVYNSLSVLINNPPAITTDFCYEFPSTGVFTVELVIFNNNGCEDVTSMEFISEIEPFEAECEGHETFTALPEDDCTYDYTIPHLVWSGGIGTPTIDVWVNSNMYQEGVVVHNLPVGTHTITYVINGDCMEEIVCINYITIECEEDKFGCPIDVLFVMDNSGSISNEDFSSMANSALVEINSINGKFTNALFSTVHYSGLCGDDIMIENDFVSASSIPSITRQFNGPMDDLDRSLDAVIDALDNVSNAHILSSQTRLNHRAGAKLYIVIYSDAWIGESDPTCTNSALRPFTSSNILKGSRFDANITMVHFIPTIAANVAEVCGAIASPGGNSVVPPFTNAGDPQGSSVPRQYIPAGFSTPNVNLCATIPPCVVCTDCEKLNVTHTETNADSCCYTIDIDNGVGNNIVKFEAEVLSSDWIFNTSSLAISSGLSWYPGSTPSANKVCITESASSTIPSGITPNALSYCFSEAVSGATSPQVVVFRWYSEIIDPNGELLHVVECTDTLRTFCIPEVNDPCLVFNEVEISCNPENSYEYFVNFTITNNGSGPVTHVSLNGAPPGFLFSDCSLSSGVSSISIPIPGGPLAVSNTSAPMCVKLISPTPILSPELVCFRAGIYSFMGGCCHAPEPVCIELIPCCDPCDITSIADPLDEGDQCCYSFGLDNNCDYQLLTKVKATILTPGVQFGYHALGASFGSNWQMCGSSANMLCIDYSGGTIPKGLHTNLLDFCLDDIDKASEVPQKVIIEYYGINTMNEDTLYCSDTLTFECGEIHNNLCLQTSNQALVCIPDSNKYRYTFDVKNISSIPFTATDIDIFVVSPTGVTLPPSGGTFPLSPPLSNGGSQTISTCVVGSSFPITDPNIVFGYRLRYLMGDTCCYESVLDTIPVPSCMDCCDDERLDQELEDYLNSLIVNNCKVSFGPVELDTCVALTINWGDGTGDSYDMDSTACKVYDGAGVYNICVQFEVYPEIGDFPCYQKDTCLTVEIVDCPLTDLCCEDEDDFDALVNQGLQITNISDCTYKVCANQFDDCHWFWTTAPIWGDGTVSNPTLTQSDAPNNCWSHTYTTQGPHVIMLNVEEQNADGEGCWDGKMQAKVECEIMEVCCEDEDDFDALVNQGLQITNIGDCKYQVCANQFDDCHWFWTTAPIWGDGTVSNPTLTQSDAPNNCWSHTYTTQGPHVIMLNVEEQNADGEACWNGNMQAEVECTICPNDGDPCDFTDINISQIDDLCCFDVTYDNQYCDNYFKGFKVTTTGTSNVSQIQAQPGWFINQLNQYEAEIYPNNNISLGSDLAFVICAASNSSSVDFTVSWLIPSPNGCEEICSEEFSETCDDDPPLGCILIVDDLVDCNQYCFRVTNNTSPGFTVTSIVLDQLTPAGVIINPNPISIPPLMPGSTSSIICVDYYNVLPGETFCYNVIAHKEDVTQGEIPTLCCTDTIQKCITVPDDCSPCDDLSINTTSATSQDTCCWSVDITNNYHNALFVGVKAKVLTSGAYFANINATSDWTLQYQAANEYIFDYNIGTGYIPLGNTVPGDFCLTGYTSGLQQVEFSWLQIDPMTGDTIEVCPIVIESDCPAPPLPIACSDISDVMIDCIDDIGNYTLQFNITNNTHLFGSGFNALSYHISNISTTGSMSVNPISNNFSPVLMPGSTTATAELVNITGAVPGDVLCFSITLHDQLVSGGSNNCCTADTVWCFVIPSDAECSIIDDCCDEYTQSDLQNDVNTVLANYDQDDCEICFNGEFPDCVNWYIDWGDGSAPISTSSGNDTWCYEYDVSGTYTACLRAFVLDPIGDTCLVNEQCIDVSPDCLPNEQPPICDPNTWDIPNGLTPNGDGFNEVLKFYKTDNCQVNIKIYNRWGQVVYTKNDYNVEWHGQSNNGENLPDGTYYLLIGTDSNRDGNFDNFVTRFIDLRRE